MYCAAVNEHANVHAAYNTYANSYTATIPTSLFSYHTQRCMRLPPASSLEIREATGLNRNCKHADTMAATLLHEISQLAMLLHGVRSLLFSLSQQRT